LFVLMSVSCMLIAFSAIAFSALMLFCRKLSAGMLVWLCV